MKNNQNNEINEILKKEGLVREMAITIKAVVMNEGNEVLLLRRSKKELTNKGKWDLPGGHIEKGETVEESLKREVLEETGLDVEMGELLRVVEFPKDHDCFLQEKRGLRFIAYVKGENNDPVLNENEHDEFIWLSIDNAIEKLSDKGFEAEKRETILKAKEFLEMKDALNGWKRALADFENYKVRVAKNNEDFKKYCTEDFVLDLLPVIDNFSMAVDHVPAEEANNPWMMGILHIQKQLTGVLEAKGVSEIVVKIGDEIDENIHEVLAKTEVEVQDSKDGNKNKEVDDKNKEEKTISRVGKVLKKGFKMGDRVIRPATVQAE